MLGLRLRQEFKDRRLKGTAIELANNSNTGATQVKARDFLEITYPTHDLLKAIEAIGPDQGRPVVTIGERGAGKSHILGALYHAVRDQLSTAAWLESWAVRLGDPQIGAIALRDDTHVIGLSLQRQEYKFLWDVLFDQHPHGKYVEGMWKGMGAKQTNVPSHDLMLEMFIHTPTMLLLDEFQTWYDGLRDTKQEPAKTWAFNFIQILAEIATEHPELLVLVVSVRNGTTDAYQQIHRVNPVHVDFRGGGSAEKIQIDRRRMLLHRLFENRLQIAAKDVEAHVSMHVNEYFRLVDTPSAEHERKTREFAEAWPFAPHLLQLLEDQVLIATDAQETRDLIRILANLFRRRNESTPVLTAADFQIEDERSEIGALLDSVANEQHRSLRDKAVRNLSSVMEAVPNHRETTPHLREIVGALWLRSITVGNVAGAEPTILQADITREERIDDNAFAAELATVVENSFNIHEEGGRLVFKEEENPRAKVMASARNDKLFADGSDLDRLAKEVRYVIGGGDDGVRTSRVIALRENWRKDPWDTVEENEKPSRWDQRLPIVVLPEEPERLNEDLGRWLKDYLQDRRNTVRFLIPRAGTTNTFRDQNLVIVARAEMKAGEWSDQGPGYRKLRSEFQRTLRDALKKRFNRFAVLRRWSFTEPSNCEFETETLDRHGADIPAEIEETVGTNLFVPEDFEEFVLQAADSNASVGKLLRELQEPRPPSNDCIAWLGETLMKERIIRLCAQGKIAINERGLEYLQRQTHEDEETAWKRLRTKVSYTGRQLDEVFLLTPAALPATGGATPATPPPGGEQEGTTPTPDDAKKQEEDGPASPGAGGAPTPPRSNIFGRGPAGTLKTFSSGATSPLNLIGKLEGWAVGPATPVKAVTLKVQDATGAQLKDVLKKLPDGMRFELSLDRENS